MRLNLLTPLQKGKVMKEVMCSSVGGQVKRSTVVQRSRMVSGKSCPQFFIFDVGIDGNGGRALVASGTLVGNAAGPESNSTGFLRQFHSPQAWARAHSRVLVSR